MSDKRKYRKFTPKQKVELVLASFRGDRSIAEICREHDLSETLLRRWRDQIGRGRRGALSGRPGALAARVAQIGRQAIYRVPKTRPSAARRSVLPSDDVEAAIIKVAEANQTDGYRMVRALVVRKLGRAVNRKRVLRVMRERRLIQRRRRLDRRRRPGFLPRHEARRALAPRHDERVGRRARLVLPDGRD